MRDQGNARLEKIFTKSEKAELWKLNVNRVRLDRVDFRSANLSGASFEHVTLAGCDFTGADLQETVFLECDLRCACFEGVRFGKNRFDGSGLAGATGLTPEDRLYIVSVGGQFGRSLTEPARRKRAGSRKGKAVKRR